MNSFSFFFRRILGLIGILVLTGIFLARAADAEKNFNGHYDLADAKADRVFSLEVEQTGQQTAISFFISSINGKGPVPSGKGKGTVEDGHLSFEFKDDFNNEGTCILEAVPGGYRIQMTITELADANVAHYYGNYLLKKTDKPVSHKKPKGE